MGLKGCPVTPIIMTRKSKDLKGSFASVQAMKAYGEVEI
jgi:hypothetical protein